MDWQAAFNAAFGLLMLVGGIMVRGAWDAIKSQRLEISQLTERIHSIETLVAGAYVKRDEFERKVDAMFEKLDRIENALHSKQDKQNGN